MPDKMQPRVISAPEPGFFKVRLIKGGPWVPARLRHEPAADPVTGDPPDRPTLWSAEINGALCGEPSHDPAEAAGVLRIWTSGRAISEQEYHHMLAVKGWAETHAPDMPEANPRSKIDFNKIPTVF